MDKTIVISKERYIDGVENLQQLILSGVTVDGVTAHDIAMVNGRVKYESGQFLANLVDAEIINSWAEVYRKLTK